MPGGKEKEGLKVTRLVKEGIKVLAAKGVAAMEESVGALAALSEAVVIAGLGTGTTDTVTVVEDGRTRAKWCPLLPCGRCHLPGCFATIRWSVSWGQCRGAIASICYASRRCFGLN